MLEASIAGTIGGVRWGEVVGPGEVRGRCSGLGVGVGLNNWGKSYGYYIRTGHARRSREDQSESTVPCLLHGVDAVVLRRGRLR